MGNATSINGFPAYEKRAFTLVGGRDNYREMGLTVKDGTRRAS